MIIVKALKNYIERTIMQRLGLNPDGPRITRLENDYRNMRGKVNRLQKKLEDYCCKCKKGLKENG